MTYSFETLRGMLDADLAAEIERIHERIMELDRDLAALKAERDRRADERRQRELDQHNYVAYPDEEWNA
jgi:50S ribosomal subunit-associated GTPase HflX